MLIPEKESNAMKTNITTATALPPAVLGPVGKAFEEVSASFDRFCLAAGIAALGEMRRTQQNYRRWCGKASGKGYGGRMEAPAENALHAFLVATQATGQRRAAARHYPA